MKFSLALAVYLMMGLVIGLGILMIMKGAYWLLITSLLIYLALFSWYGCLHR